MKKFYSSDYVNDGCEYFDQLSLFHISHKKLTSIKSIIPHSAGRKENNTVKRICFSPSINGCISAIWPTRSDFYVYVPEKPINELSLIVPSIKDCYDCKETKEIWCIDDKVELKCIGKIHVNLRKFVVERKYNYISYHYDIIKHPWVISEILDNSYKYKLQNAFEYQNKYIKNISI